jgi:hypothetical protein
MILTAQMTVSRCNVTLHSAREICVRALRQNTQCPSTSHGVALRTLTTAENKKTRKKTTLTTTEQQQQQQQQQP